MTLYHLSIYKHNNKIKF